MLGCVKASAVPGTCHPSRRPSAELGGQADPEHRMSQGVRSQAVEMEAMPMRGSS